MLLVWDPCRCFSWMPVVFEGAVYSRLLEFLENSVSPVLGRTELFFDMFVRFGTDRHPSQKKDTFRHGTELVELWFSAVIVPDLVHGYHAFLQGLQKIRKLLARVIGFLGFGGDKEEGSLGLECFEDICSLLNGQYYIHLIEHRISS